MAKFIESEITYLPVQIIYCVSKNVKNMTATAEKLQFEHLSCAVHDFHLIIRDVLLDCSSELVKQKFKYITDKSLGSLLDNTDVEECLTRPLL